MRRNLARGGGDVEPGGGFGPGNGGASTWIVRLADHEPAPSSGADGAVLAYAAKRSRQVRDVGTSLTPGAVFKTQSASVRVTPNQ